MDKIDVYRMETILNNILMRRWRKEYPLMADQRENSMKLLDYMIWQDSNDAESRVMKDIAKKIASLSRPELVTAIFHAYPEGLPIEIRDQIKFVDSKNMSFDVQELCTIIGRSDFVEWAGVQIDDLEFEDAKEFYDILQRMQGEITVSMIRKGLEEFLSRKCPDPDMELYHAYRPFMGDEKAYYLPALKVLVEDERRVLWSPSFRVPWIDDTLESTHRGYGDLWSANKLNDRENVHSAMEGTNYMATCTCGIYASVNMDEIYRYMMLEGSNLSHLLLGQRPDLPRRLCIIEPSPDATVYLARKGWKATKAFVSEILGETMDYSAASNLLSMVWHRKIDVETGILRRQYENWQNE